MCWQKLPIMQASRVCKLMVVSVPDNRFQWRTEPTRHTCTFSHHIYLPPGHIFRSHSGAHDCPGTRSCAFGLSPSMLSVFRDETSSTVDLSFPIASFSMFDIDLRR